MRILNHIAVLVMGMIFLVSSSGFMVYKSSCACNGEEYTSVFVLPTGCKTEYHHHHEKQLSNQKIVCSAEECNDCTEHTKTCGCDSPQFFFFKLKDKAIDDQANFLAAQSVELVVFSSTIAEELQSENSFNFAPNSYTSPPPKLKTSLDFLIQINQLKIPSLA